MKEISFAHRLLPVVALSLVAFTACHARAAADPARPSSPSMDVEVEDRGPDKSEHLAKLTVAFVDGHAQLSTRDGDAKYDLQADTVGGPDPFVKLSLKRGHADHSLDVDITSSIAAHASGRVVVARIARADGRMTNVTAHVH